MNTGTEVIGAITVVIVALILGALIGAIPTWLLWNWLMPIIFKLPEITLLQALGLNFLASMLFKSSKVSVGK